MATRLGKRVALIDTEHHSAEKYASDFEFDTLNLDNPTIEAYENAIREGDKAGYEVVIIDSLTHAWLAAQQMLDDEAAKSKTGNSFNAWGKVTPVWNRLLRTIISTNCHVIGTCRSKVDYILETDSRGKQVPRKVGMAPIMREGAEYEFDVSAEMDLEHRMLISKTRCSALDGKVFTKPGADVADILLSWLGDGTPPPIDHRMALHEWSKPLIESGVLQLEEIKRRLAESNNNYAQVRADLERELAELTPAKV